jgi:phosphoribosylformylglycinamidine synthase subunit PurQ / glutaminase
MKAAIITFPGSNCDEDARYTLAQQGFEVESVWHKQARTFENHQLVVLPGGFSYGDYLRCGAIAALSPVMDGVKKFADKGGAVLGICNGFQTLCEAGLLPGALVSNEKLKFVCKTVGLRVTGVRAPWTSELKSEEVLKIPVAHGDGRYWIDTDGLETLKKNQQVLFSYDENPNGSVGNIAGVCNEKGNVFGLMPHPERATDLGSKDGVKFWKSVIKNLGARA